MFNVSDAREHVLEAGRMGCEKCYLPGMQANSAAWALSATLDVLVVSQCVLAAKGVGWKRGNLRGERAARWRLGGRCLVQRGQPSSEALLSWWLLAPPDGQIPALPTPHVKIVAQNAQPSWTSNVCDSAKVFN